MGDDRLARLHKVDPGVFAAELDTVAKMDPTMVFSSHLPPAPGTPTTHLLASLAAVPGAPHFVGPDQAALEQMLAQMTGGHH